jgi:hypothetical protein
MYGDLAKAVRRESVAAVADCWRGVGPGCVEVA